jgi:hypothetical protein
MSYFILGVIALFAALLITEWCLNRYATDPETVAQTMRQYLGIDPDEPVIDTSVPIGDYEWPQVYDRDFEFPGGGAA